LGWLPPSRGATRPTSRRPPSSWTRRSRTGVDFMIQFLAILYLIPSPQGWNFSPREMFTPSFTPGVNTLYCVEEWRGEQWISPPGDNLTARGQSLT
jgi:hypothetical protein